MRDGMLSASTLVAKVPYHYGNCMATLSAMHHSHLHFLCHMPSHHTCCHVVIPAQVVGITLITSTNMPLGRDGPMVHIGAPSHTLATRHQLHSVLL